MGKVLLVASPNKVIVDQPRSTTTIFFGCIFPIPQLIDFLLHLWQCRGQTLFYSLYSGRKGGPSFVHHIQAERLDPVSFTIIQTERAEPVSFTIIQAKRADPVSFTISRRTKS